MNKKISSGVVHAVPKDLRDALIADDSIVERWNDLTPLARNEWICWTITNKKPETRKKHIERITTDLLVGKHALVVGPAVRIDKLSKGDSNTTTIPSISLVDG